jgi:hypothetical protein
MILGLSVSAGLKAEPGDCNTDCRERDIFLKLGSKCIRFAEPVCTYCTSTGVILGGCRSGEPVLPGVCTIEKDKKGKDVVVLSATFEGCKANCYVENDQKYVEAKPKEGTVLPDPINDAGNKLRKCKAVIIPAPGN